MRPTHGILDLSEPAPGRTLFVKPQTITVLTWANKARAKVTDTVSECSALISVGTTAPGIHDYTEIQKYTLLDQYRTIYTILVPEEKNEMMHRLPYPTPHALTSSTTKMIFPMTWHHEQTSSVRPSHHFSNANPSLLSPFCIAEMGGAPNAKRWRAPTCLEPIVSDEQCCEGHQSRRRTAESDPTSSTPRS